MSERVTIEKAKFDAVLEASWGIAYLGTLLRYSGAYAQSGALSADNKAELHLSELGAAVKWAGEMMDKFTADINEAVTRKDVLP